MSPPGADHRGGSRKPGGTDLMTRPHARVTIEEHNIHGDPGSAGGLEAQRKQSSFVVPLKHSGPFHSNRSPTVRDCCESDLPSRRGCIAGSGATHLRLTAIQSLVSASRLRATGARAGPRLCGCSPSWLRSPPAPVGQAECGPGGGPQLGAKSLTIRLRVTTVQVISTWIVPRGGPQRGWEL